MKIIARVPEGTDRCGVLIGWEFHRVHFRLVNEWIYFRIRWRPFRIFFNFTPRGYWRD